MRSRNTQYETRCRNDAVVRAQYRRAQPADAFGAVSFLVASSSLRKNLEFGAVALCCLKRVGGSGDVFERRLWSLNACLLCCDQFRNAN